MKRKIYSMIVLLFGVVFMRQASFESKATEDEFMCSYSAEEDAHYSAYGCDRVLELSETEAVAAGLPAGYSGNVLSIENASDLTMGFLLDFSARNIPINSVKSLTFRVYVGADSTSDDGYPEIRIMEPGTAKNGWFLRYDASNLTDQWIDVVVSETSFETFAKDGYLDKMELGIRKKSSGNDVFYVDSITYQLKETDITAPVIEINTDSVYAVVGTKPIFYPVITDNTEISSIIYTWSEGALDQYGRLNEGTHTWIVKAVDSSQNTAEKAVTVYVTQQEYEDKMILDEEEIAANSESSHITALITALSEARAKKAEENITNVSIQNIEKAQQEATSVLATLSAYTNEEINAVTKSLNDAVDNARTGSQVSISDTNTGTATLIAAEGEEVYIGYLDATYSEQGIEGQLYIVGWTDSNGQEVTTWTQGAIPKVIDTKMLMVKYQSELSQGYTDKYRVRFLSSVNNTKDYKKAGLVFSLTDEVKNPDIHTGIKRETTKVYKNINADGISMNVKAVYGEYSEFIYGRIINKIPERQTIYVRAFVELLDGTIVYGKTREIKVDSTSDFIEIEDTETGFGPIL